MQFPATRSGGLRGASRPEPGSSSSSLLAVAGPTLISTASFLMPNAVDNYSLWSSSWLDCPCVMECGSKVVLTLSKRNPSQYPITKLINIYGL